MILKKKKKMDLRGELRRSTRDVTDNNIRLSATFGSRATVPGYEDLVYSPTALNFVKIITAEFEKRTNASRQPTPLTEVRKSTIPDSDDGLFALCDFAVGEVVTEYAADIVDMADMNSDSYPIRQYVYGKVTENYGMDAERFKEYAPPNCNGARLNDPWTNKLYNTVAIVQTDMEDYPILSKNLYKPKQAVPSIRLFIVATKPIFKGQELFLSYGMNYWYAKKTQAPSKNLIQALIKNQAEQQAIAENQHTFKR